MIVSSLALATLERAILSTLRGLPVKRLSTVVDHPKELDYRPKAWINVDFESGLRLTYTFPKTFIDVMEKPEVETAADQMHHEITEAGKNVRVRYMSLQALKAV